METENNPWDDTEKQTYRKRLKIILGIEIIAFAVALIFKKDWISKVIMLDMLTESLMLLIGALKIIAIR